MSDGCASSHALEETLRIGVQHSSVTASRVKRRLSETRAGAGQAKLRCELRALTLSLSAAASHAADAKRLNHSAQFAARTRPAGSAKFRRVVCGDFATKNATCPAPAPPVRHRACAPWLPLASSAVLCARRARLGAPFLKPASSSRIFSTPGTNGS